MHTHLLGLREVDDDSGEAEGVALQHRILAGLREVAVEHARAVQRREPARDAQQEHLSHAHARAMQCGVGGALGMGCTGRRAARVALRSTAACPKTSRYGAPTARARPSAAR